MARKKSSRRTVATVTVPAPEDGPAPGRRRATPPGIIALVDGKRIRWQPNATYGEPGTFTGPDSVLSRIHEAIERHSSLPLRGVLVTAGATTAPEAMAAIELSSRGLLRYVEKPAELDDWFAENRRAASTVTSEDMQAAPEPDLLDRMTGVLRRRLV